ncbi:hypothetical protein [Bacillus sp. 165]|uniref:hypothetical protein n=1 Tax=Bacillus sp. 165 TaxID=1529117 RepID=UPI001ADB1C33|nr:hypothetical protein [Bacillus sp. 165]MBO9130013.1 hypothetical protein [Bacillus sp. 165]
MNNPLQAVPFSNLELRHSSHADAALTITDEDGVTVATGFIHEQKEGGYTVHLLAFPQEEEEFMISELAPISFPTSQEMFFFLSRLPKMSGLDMLGYFNKPAVFSIEAAK